MRRRRRRLDRLEQDVPDENRPVARILRQVIALGRHAHSQVLRSWALRELQGHEGSDIEVPNYRCLPVPLGMDRFSRAWQFPQQSVSRFDLPDFARDALGGELRLATSCWRQFTGRLSALLVVGKPAERLSEPGSSLSGCKNVSTIQQGGCMPS